MRSKSIVGRVYFKFFLFFKEEVEFSLLFVFINEVVLDFSYVYLLFAVVFLRVGVSGYEIVRFVKWDMFFVGFFKFYGLFLRYFFYLGVGVGFESSCVFIGVLYFDAVGEDFEVLRYFLIVDFFVGRV